MRVIAKIGLVVVALAAFLSGVIGVGVCIGATLHWLIPSVDIGLAVIIGLLALLLTAFLVTSIVQTVVQMSKNMQNAQENAEWDEDEEDEEPQAEVIAKYVAEELINRTDLAFTSGGRRRRN